MYYAEWSLYRVFFAPCGRPRVTARLAHRCVRVSPLISNAYRVLSNCRTAVNDYRIVRNIHGSLSKIFIHRNHGQALVADISAKARGGVRLEVRRAEVEATVKGRGVLRPSTLPAHPDRCVAWRRYIAFVVRNTTGCFQKICPRRSEIFGVRCDRPPAISSGTVPRALFTPWKIAIRLWHLWGAVVVRTRVWLRMRYLVS